MSIVRSQQSIGGLVRVVVGNAPYKILDLSYDKNEASSRMLDLLLVGITTLPF